MSNFLKRWLSLLNSSINIQILDRSPTLTRIQNPHRSSNSYLIQPSLGFTAL